MSKQKIKAKKIKTQQDIDNLKIKDVVEIEGYTTMMCRGREYHYNSNFNFVLHDLVFLCRDKQKNQILTFYFERKDMFPNRNNGNIVYKGLARADIYDRRYCNKYSKIEFKRLHNELLKEAGLWPSK